jgi:DNA primase
MITIKRDNVEYELDVDVLEELNYYDWNRARVKAEEMIACSPFRDEKSPSFSINLETGLFIDFGSDDLFSRGNLITLLSFLRNETPQEIEDYLLEKYGIDLSDVSKLKLNFDLKIETKVNVNIDIETYKQFAYRSPYLATRGITEKVQRAFKIGYDKRNKAVAIPWFDTKGNIVNIKFRSTKSKKFFYFADGQPIRNHIYGMHFIYRSEIKKIYIVESEIDALFLWSNGFPAVALGGSNVSEKQKQLLLRCPANEFVLATDNDKVGKEIRKKLIAMFIGSKTLSELVLPESVKDVNELNSDQIKALANDTKPVEFRIF